MNYELREASTKIRVTFVLCVLFVLFFFSNVFSQENFTITNYFTDRYRDFPMMKISIIPADGFVKDTNETGFINLKYNAAIRAEEVRLGVSIASTNFLKSFDSIEHKDSLGMKLVESFNFKINGYDAHVVNLFGKVEGDDYIEWRIFIGDNADTYIVTGFIPASKKKVLERQVRSALLSVFYEPTRRLIPPGGDPTTTNLNACGCHSKK